MGERVIREINLPCKITELETAILNVAHSGHGHDGMIKVSTDGTKAVIYVVE